MPEETEIKNDRARDAAAEIGPGTIYTCWMEYSAAIEASDKSPETLKGLWEKYIVALRKTPRTISDCMREYREAVKALGSVAELPDTKSGLWKTYMTLVKDYPQTPENLRDAGWTVPERGDELRFSNPCFRFSGELPELPALPNSRTISSPDFVTPNLTPGQAGVLAFDSTKIHLPALWGKTAVGMNALRVGINNQPPFEVPLDIAENAEGVEVAEKLQAAVRVALGKALDYIAVLEKRHESGTAEPGPYRLAFKLVEVDKEDSTAKFMTDRGAACAEVGK